MKSTRKTPELRRLLNTCDDLQKIKSKMTDPELEQETRTRLRRQSKRKTEQLARDLKSYHFKGPLAQVVESFPLAPDHFQILAVLLQRQMRCEDPALEGRLILAAIAESAYEALARIELIQQDSPLRASGLVALDDGEECPEDLLEARFVLSEEAIAGFREEIAGVRTARADFRKATGDSQPFAGNRDFLVELRLLHNLYRLRSEKVFYHERWNRLRHTEHPTGRNLTARIHNSWARLRDRLTATPEACSYPAVRMMREYGLSEEEIMCVIHLLFRELFEGNAYADVAELLKLISADEPELIGNRRLVSERSPLIKHEILRVEPMLEGRTLTGEAYLSDWVINYMFGSTTTEETIHTDERIDWHVYLSQLDDSRGFYRDLDA